jgi:hypothetical protein
LAKQKKPFQATTFQGFCILTPDENGILDLWTSAVFPTREDAQSHIKKRALSWDLSKLEIVPCKAAVSLINYE